LSFIVWIPYSAGIFLPHCATFPAAGGFFSSWLALANTISKSGFNSETARSPVNDCCRGGVKFSTSIVHSPNESLTDCSSRTAFSLALEFRVRQRGRMAREDLPLYTIKPIGPRFQLRGPDLPTGMWFSTGKGAVEFAHESLRGEKGCKVEVHPYLNSASSNRNDGALSNFVAEVYWYWSASGEVQGSNF
jgi:hypothetical protein